MGGDAGIGYSHTTLPFYDGLEKGVYIAFFQVEFPKSTQNVERKLVFSIYCNQPVSSLQRVSFEDYPKEAIGFFTNTLTRKTGLMMTEMG